MLDKEKVINSCYAEDIANLIGMEIFPKGKYKYIYCPGHFKRLGKVDSKPTNAILTPHGYKCYACGCRINTIDMVSEFTGKPFYESLKLVASLIGGEEFYQADAKEKSPNIPLTKEEYDLLGISTNACKKGRITHISPVYKDEETNYNSEYDEDLGSYISYDTSISFSIKDLFYEDYPFYCQMIRNCAKNRMLKIAEVIERCNDPNYLMSVRIRTREDRDMLIKTLCDMNDRIYKIYQDYCKKDKLKPLSKERLKVA